jgi:PPK2 family polyphosphate:nucleotide phosphotransferase
MNKTHLAERYRVDGREKFRLSEMNPGDTWKLRSKEHAEQWLDEGVAELSDLQGKLYAQNQWSLLLIFQAMDAAGKDSTVKHVMSGVNPQGCQVFSFKAPSTEELDHDFLWRTHKCVPERGRIGIFNRSYYEEVLVVRVHPNLLQKQNLPKTLLGKNIWRDRFDDIRAFEKYLSRNGVIIRKFFLHVSKKEQKKRLLARLDSPDKNWKFSVNDLAERERWDDYMSAYQDMIRHTASDEAPWYVVPADHKWFTSLVVAQVAVEALKSVRLDYPAVSPEQHKELARARKLLTRS